LFSLVALTPAVQSLRERVEKGESLSLDAVSPAAQPFLAVLLSYLLPGRPVIVVTDNLKTQEVFQQDIQTWLAQTPDPASRPPVPAAAATVESAMRDPQSSLPAQAGHGSTESRPTVLGNPQSAIHPPLSATGSTTAELPAPLFYPSWEVLPHEARLPHVDVISERLETLVALAQHSKTPEPAQRELRPTEGTPPLHHSTTPPLHPPLVVASVTALLEKTLPPAELERRTRRLRQGDHTGPLDLIEWLEAQGYEPEAQVTQKGDISLRGGIVDLWPLTSRFPVRLEFFGDELESLRHFDPITQISRDTVEEIIIPPGGELGLLKQALGRDEAGRGGSAGASPCQAASLLDYLPAGALFLLCDPESLDAQAGRYESQVQAGHPLLISWRDFQAETARRGMVSVSASELENLFSENQWEACETWEQCDLSLPPAPSLAPAPSAPSVPLLPLFPSLPSSGPVFQGLEVFRPIGDHPPEAHIAEAQRKEFFGQVHRWARQGFAVFVFCNNDGEQQRFGEVWAEYGLGPTSQLQIRAGALARGFLFDAAKLAVVTDAEVFGRYKVQRPRRLKSPHAQTSRSLLDINFSELEEGDYVVHLQHGIGRYLGLQPMPSRLASPLRPHSPAAGDECLVIEYRAGDDEDAPPKLYVPVSEAHLVSKYVGAGKGRPRLNSLGGARWAKTKSKAEDAVRDLASDMLAVHAARASQPGHAFPPDAGWQCEFESSFIYEETPDQIRAIAATKQDMEAPRPMDRLICGDVGYGKTEVALRAAFKAALGGKQVAVLTPTTVLAQQHFNTFRERMADYPLRLELLSRFRSRPELAAAIRQLAAGSVDIVIGTHRLLQRDISFKDLGLVIIDEEQRFGVLHKEKFKQLRATVDVLTLTATPIPRTLYLALAGARDMSTIETPPQDRLPVQTLVVPFDERTVRDAIQRELNRGGQVFYLHNRILDIQAVGHRLRALVPQARIAIGHGRMDAGELEEVMAAFVNGRTDVLLSTSIIESGLDIPNANTIIIDRADRFGLSDLYQLRGRVGRYKHQAYAYLLLPRHAGLLLEARKRISAIKQYSTLGSGFRIAMRDLEIRGAGNLLGAEQSGHITAVGFELYCQLLKQSVSNLKGEKTKPRLEVQLRLDFLLHSREERPSGPNRPEPRAATTTLDIQVPREVSVWVGNMESGKQKAEMGHPQSAIRPDGSGQSAIQVAAATLPAAYIPEARHRIDLYRKLAQAADPAALRDLKSELRDRFGPLPASAQLLLKATELKLIAAERNVTVIETQGDKLMLTRNNDYLMISGKFPRLTRATPSARLNEIKKLLLSL
jgi:transcription-repair coupling factor (superfamily II helicase)